MADWVSELLNCSGYRVSVRAERLVHIVPPIHTAFKDKSRLNTFNGAIAVCSTVGNVGNRL